MEVANGSHDALNFMREWNNALGRCADRGINGLKMNETLKLNVCL